MNLPSTCGARAFDVEALFGQKDARVLDFVNARGFDVDGFEACRGQLGGVIRVLQRSRDTAHPQQHVLADFIRHVAMYHNVRHGETATWLEHAEGFAENAVLVGREIDDAVGDDDVDGVIGQGNVFDFALEELDILDTGLALILARESEHLVGHVESVGFAGGTDALSREQDIDAAAGAEVENDLAGVQLRQRRRIAATERSFQRRFRNLLRLGRVVKIAGDGIAAEFACGSGAAAAAGRSGLHTQGRLPVFLFHRLLDVGRHGFSCFYLGVRSTSSGRTTLLRVQHSLKRNVSSSRSASVFAVYHRKVPSRRTFTRPSFFSLSR